MTKREQASRRSFARLQAEHVMGDKLKQHLLQSVPPNHASQAAILRKYYWEEIPLLKPQFSEAILDHSSHYSPRVQPAAYLTINQFSSAEEAHRYLAITYTPKFEMTFEVEPEEQRRIILVNPQGGHKWTRIWPAFGLHGGAWELILTKGELQASRKEQRFPEGGKFDAYVAESATSDKILVSSVATSFLEWLRRRKEEVPGLGGGPWYKVLDGVGVISAWFGLPSAKFYSISCSYRKEDDESAIMLKFWGYVWRDNEDNSRRFLSPPKDSKLRLNLTLDQLRGRLRDRDLIIGTALEQTLTAIHDRLISIARNFDGLDLESIVLPL